MKKAATPREKKHLRSSPVLNKSEWHSLVGLLELAAQQVQLQKDIEEAVLGITKECDGDGIAYIVYGGGHSGDAVYEGSQSYHAAKDLIRKLGLKVKT